MHLVSNLSVLLLVGCAMSLPQVPVRPFYVQSGSSYPKVLSRFNTDADDSAIDTRLGEGDANNVQESAATVTPGQVDQDIMNRIASWPKELQPFWYVNSKAIAGQRGQEVPCRNCLNSNVQLQPQPQSPFIRPASNRN